MKYDFFANFYEKATDASPAYRCPIGVYDFHNNSPFFYLDQHGFVEDENSTEGYRDFTKEVSADSLSYWVKEGFDSEVMDILFGEKTFEKITVQAQELDILDDEGTTPVRGLPISDCFVLFDSTEPYAPVVFMEGTPYDHNEDARTFSIPLIRLKEYFKVQTMLEVMDGLQVFADGNPWTFDQLKEYFEAGVDEAVQIVSSLFGGKRDYDGNPEILHALSVGMQGANKTEIIAGFLHDVVEDTDMTLEDLSAAGFSQEVITVVDLLTHRKLEDSYEAYIDKILASGNLHAVAVKINDLRHNIARGEAGHHTGSVAKHNRALKHIETVLSEMLAQVKGEH